MKMNQSFVYKKQNQSKKIPETEYDREDILNCVLP